MFNTGAFEVRFNYPVLDSSTEFKIFVNEPENYGTHTHPHTDHSVQVPQAVSNLAD